MRTKRSIEAIAGDRPCKDSVVELQRTAGLEPPDVRRFRWRSKREERHFAEAVVSQAADIAGSTIRDAGFRERYHAVVVAVSSRRNGSADRLAIRIPVKANTPNRPSRPAAPMNPSSSPTMAKMKSL